MTAPKPQPLGDRLRESRKSRGLSLREVERRSGVNSGYLSQLERNEIANPTPSVLQKVADAYEEPFAILMRWAGYVEDDPDGVSPNAKRALDTLGDDFTDEELQALRAVLDAIRARNRATLAPLHRTDLILGGEQRQRLRANALAVLRELDAVDTPERVDMDDVLLVAKLVKAGVIELTIDEKRRLRDRFKDMVDWALASLQGVVHLDRGEVYLNPELDRWEQRKRFVLGHEVGHAVLKDHRLTFAHLDDGTRLRPDFADRLEREANQFSVELLAKGDRLRSEFDDSPPDLDQIRKLSQSYGISIQAAARRVAEESKHPCAVAIAYRSQKGEGPLYLSGLKLWCSETFAERMGWRTTGPPATDLQRALQVTAAGGALAPLNRVDGEGRPVEIAVEGLDIRFAVFVLLSCAPKPRINLRRANPFLRTKSA